MKILNLILIILTILNVVIEFSNARSSEKEKCSFKIYPGISNDGMGNILIIGKPTNPKNESKVFVSGVYKIPMFGMGDDSISRKLDVNGEVLNGGSNSMSINLFYGYLPKQNIYYFRMNHAGQPVFSILKPSFSSSELKQVFNIHNTPFVPAINGDTFIYGAYGIYRLNKLPEDVRDAQLSIQLYKDQIINGLSFDNENKTVIYMSTYQGTFLKGDINCINCTKDQLELIGNDANAQSANDLLVYKDMIYYSYPTGIRGFPKNGNGNPIQLVSSENVNSMVQLNGKIYFSTNEGLIKSIKLPNSSSTSNQPKTIFNSSYYTKCQ
ncbi:hypothetical protein ACTFIZ_010416 [Dictyostelium cf. discoideum]